ncbi:MAG: prolipoprotein diacylglyceryl transferase [Gammaproteobacteria bacterium]|nr:prolipoprotein diacylglyceryl transferase [Gammaproteobacteria bacterium]
MIVHPEWDPVALAFGPIKIHWYGLSYILAFILFISLAHRRLKHQPFVNKPLVWQSSSVDELLVYGVLGVILGGRIGYCLFYQFSYYIAHPIEILFVWQGGMSFHGGLLGVLTTLWIYAYKKKIHFFEVTDFVSPCVPLGLASGRVGNFINQELWGRVVSADIPWAMVFPKSGDNLPRHPSQIYQMFFEGIILFIVLWVYTQKPYRVGRISGLFLIGYSLTRFSVEYFREPDAHLGLLYANLSMGQWLTIPLALIGVFLCFNSSTKRNYS